MAKGRKKGCPVNVRDWLIEILNPADNGFVRIYGLNSMTYNTDSDTEDGSSETDIWEEPYVKKRSGSVSLEGKPVIEQSTGVRDEGQELLNDYAKQAGCDGDATCRFTDPYGHSWIGDYIISGHERSTDSDGEKESWDLEQVGEVEPQPYVHVSSISFQDGSSQALAALSLTVGGTAGIVKVIFNPAGASNKRFRVSNSKRSVCSVGSVTEDGFTVTPVAVGTSTITVTTVEGAKTATLSVTVAAES